MLKIKCEIKIRMLTASLFLLLFQYSKSQFNTINFQEDYVVKDVELLNDSMLLCVGLYAENYINNFENSKNKALLLTWNTNNNTYELLNLNLPYNNVIGFDNVQLLDGFILLYVRYYDEATTTKIQPFCSKLTADTYTVVETNTLMGDFYGSVRFNRFIKEGDKQVVIYSDTDIKDHRYFHLYRIDNSLGVELYKRFEIETVRKAPFEHCTSLFKEKNSSDYLFTKYDTADFVYRLDSIDFSVEQIASLPDKTTASTNDPGYTYNECVGGGYLPNGDLFYALKYLSLETGRAPILGKSASITSFNENFEVLESLSFGDLDDLNKPLCFAENLEREKFLAYIDNFVGFTQPNASVSNNVSVVKFTENLNKLWEVSFTEESSLFPYAIVPTTEGGLVVIGTRSKFEETQFRDPFVLRINAEGLITAISFLQEQDFNVYPNPVIGSTVQVDLALEQHVLNYQVHSQTGQLLTSGVLNAGNTSITLPTNIVPGTYFILFQDEAGASIAKKIIKQ